jgi:hemoglobin
MTVEIQAQAHEASGDEVAIELCVRRFYERAQKDPMLARIFEVSVPDWEHHISKIHDFWSRALLGTERYEGFPFPPHMRLPVETEHFERWLELFEGTARETLSPELAEKAIERARHMATAFQAGIFPYVGKDGRPSRLPG